ncbi:response regulator [Microbacterium sp. NPDC057659]|uniref:response regulator n=1 Tax=Microbacterium sp. NPDC057659 TaxID=3346198 RepID=UPI003671F5CF
MTEPLRVLIVDDDFRVAGLHRDIVDARPGFRAVGTAPTLAAALRAVQEHSPDLMLVDAYLPDGDGVRFIASHPIDAILISAAADGSTVRRALRAGALSVLTKPFASQVLETRLDAYARFRNLLPEDHATNQEQIDRALAILHGGGEPVSTGRSATETLILAHLGEDEASAAEIAERAGVSRATAQRHLAALATRGLIEVRLRYGSTGRPEHRYIRPGT